MAATRNLSQLARPNNSIVPRHGVVTLFGYGIQVRIDRGHLLLDDGLGAERRHFRLPRVGHGLKRLVAVGADGFVSLSALRWLADQGISFSLLERDGKILATTGPVHSSDAKLRRAQALALGDGVGLEICRSLISAKLEGQERVVRERLNDKATGEAIASFRNRLTIAETVDAIRRFEAHAAVSYFGAWRNIPILWPKSDLRRVPDHWRTIGSRQSPLSGGPRLAVTPAHAILNYCFALLESESRLALAALGLDPGLGVGLHTDTANRDSLALDVLEPVRPQIEDWVLNWIMREPLRRADFFETGTGNCRLMSNLCAKLSETAPTWGKLVAPWAEYVARRLWSSTQRSKTNRFSTPLTQQHRRQAKDRPPLPTVTVPKPARLCRNCGKEIAQGNDYCPECAVPVMRTNFDLGRKLAQSPESLAKRSETQRMHKQAIRDWKSSDLPAWLTRDVYVNHVVPALATATNAQIRSALGVSEPYSSNIRAGRCCPHPRHWLALAHLVGIQHSIC